MIPVLPVSDLFEIARYLLWMLLTGLLAFPLARRLFPASADRGYLAAKILGWLLVSYVPWLLASMRLISFNDHGVFVGLAALGVIAILFRREGFWPEWRRLLACEVLVAGLFVVGLCIRLMKPELTGLEKFTNLGFMTAVLRAENFPPEDMWLAGETINYYFLGHVGAAFWTRLVDVSPDHGYQLHMAALFALTGAGVFRLTLELCHRGRRGARRAAAWVSTGLVLLAGNLHSVLYTVLRPLMGSAFEAYAPSNSTRFIGYEPETQDKTITEFVAYSFHVGDMHGHVLATPVFLLALNLLWAIWKNRGAEAGNDRLRVVVLGWTMGVCYATNAWDLAIIGLMAAIVWSFLILPDLRTSGMRRLDRHVADGFLTLFSAFAATAPFIAGFTPFANGAVISDIHSPLWQLAVLYGHGILPLLGIGLLLGWPGRARSPEILFVAMLAVFAVALIAIPEFIYVDDILRDEFRRANTMFKLSYRAQMLIFIISVCVIYALLCERSLVRRIIGTLAAVPVLATFIFAGYTLTALPSTAGLDGLGFLGEERALVETVRAMPLAEGEAILEANGRSFTEYNPVSAVTGKPTVLGWFEHEWLWRNTPEIGNRRKADIDGIYQATEALAACRLLGLYNVRYVVIASLERKAYPEAEFEVLRSLGWLVFDDSRNVVLELDRARCGRIVSSGTSAEADANGVDE